MFNQMNTNANLSGLNNRLKTLSPYNPWVKLVKKVPGNTFEEKVDIAEFLSEKYEDRGVKLGKIGIGLGCGAVTVACGLIPPALILAGALALSGAILGGLWAIFRHKASKYEQVPEAVQQVRKLLSQQATAEPLPKNVAVAAGTPAG